MRDNGARKPEEVNEIDASQSAVLRVFPIDAAQGSLGHRLNNPSFGTRG
jgi:hypothetical protein